MGPRLMHVHVYYTINIYVMLRCPSVFRSIVTKIVRFLVYDPVDSDVGELLEHSSQMVGSAYWAVLCKRALVINGYGRVCL